MNYYSTSEFTRMPTYAKKEQRSKIKKENETVKKKQRNCERKNYKR